LDFIDVRAIGNKLLRSTRYCARAFTLVEVAIAIVIVGVSSIALMQLAAVCAFQNRAASQATTAVLLAEHLREMLADLPLNDPTVGSTHFGAESGETLASYDDVDDFDGKTFQPVVDASRVALSGFEGFSQSVVVNPVNTTQHIHRSRSCHYQCERRRSHYRNRQHDLLDQQHSRGGMNHGHDTIAFSFQSSTSRLGRRDGAAVRRRRGHDGRGHLHIRTDECAGIRFACALDSRPGRRRERHPVVRLAPHQDKQAEYHGRHNQRGGCRRSLAEPADLDPQRFRRKDKHRGASRDDELRFADQQPDLAG
jgi:prepilin-type N-terminal cleavage/methylation domain-containing protein